MTAPRHFLDIDKLDGSTLRGILEKSAAMKAARRGAPKGRIDQDAPCAGHLLAMMFDKPSTRTRVSFDVAMRQLGGESLVLNGSEMQMGRGETPGDTARVLSRMVDVIMIRTFEHAVLLEMSEQASVPVINGLTDDSHPCQLMADVMTFEEHKGPIKGKSITWTGDGNNMAKTWIDGAARFGYRLRLACPDPLSPPEDVVARARAEGAEVSVGSDPEAAVDGTDCVIADTWVSMGDDAGDRHNLLKPYQVNRQLMARAAKDAIFMHCLPAHRGEEVTNEVMDGPQSVVFDEAENRLHAQKGILTWCLGKS